MIVVSAKDLTKTYGEDIVLDKISFHINKGERVGIVGINGAGKSTLLKILTGEMDCEEGEFFISADLKTGYLRQDDGFSPENTVIEEVEKIFFGFMKMEEEMNGLLQRMKEGEEDVQLLGRYDDLHEKYKDEGGYTYKSEMTGVLSSMGFGEGSLDKKISSLSGGERTRLALACLLLEKPDILFLDEPTNHLDISTIKWLEQYLKNYKGTMVLVSHDRYFLDETVTRIFEIENHRLNIYEGNYSFYASERKKRRETEMRSYEKQQKELKRQEEIIRRFKQHGTEKLAKRAASREKRLSSVELIRRPDGEHGKVKIRFKENFQSGKDVIFAEDLSKSFGYGEKRRELFRNVDLDIKRGERVCIIGDNGIGKTTLLRMILGEIPCTQGRIKIGYNVQMGYYDQGQRLLDNDNTVIDELHESYRLYTQTELRNLLGRFLFKGEAVFLKVGSLSGGEKARLSLLKLMMSGANMLILDEPTNHLDIESKEVFEEALLEFPGTCLVVSHDRYFLNRVPTRIIELTKDGVKNYLGKYDYYMEKKKEEENLTASEDRRDKAEDNEITKIENNRSKESETENIRLEETGLSSAEKRKIKKEKEAQQRRLMRQKEAVESDIRELENDISKLENEVSLKENMTDHQKLAKIGRLLDEKKKLLDEKYEEWLVLQEH